MSIIRVEAAYHRHTCPADPEPHVVDTRHRVLDVIPGGGCLTPVTVRSGDTTRLIACGRHEPASRQCRACRPVITEVRTEVYDTGAYA
ncbi:hypothetical protein [Catellatospora citrea]|uniref:Uncharacterized protein n=1 Tax=Catellatospora citrea TaxID=53366 RepID=A0A8J3P3W3_9ACTN|nr:hypothetical protein [Catellatospora citrea]RKE08169.1 hypothetical protein C8E86_3013 [Catellatospora citrea]GIG03243.1 hypothetical protein Cci01nite_83360 [Catellatospora citrea]